MSHGEEYLMGTMVMLSLLRLPLSLLLPLEEMVNHKNQHMVVTERMQHLTRIITFRADHCHRCGRQRRYH
ncbi:hypothetical protein LOAG_00284 [Loa loa]|uniref:Secreted protein n=1 Tax=Loa loa TaxID=7209 RepID=A0A1S0UCB6_LOALO|nr:hypothetical protein LOAG_00284 [Loa loa]EFO28202.1 hypothetical protein LOAG_00284 [Loa loa]